MKTIMIVMLTILAIGCSCSTSAEKPAGQQARIANPASVKCIEDGHRLEIRTSENGGQYGVCIDAAGNECEEWAYFRGECTFPK